MVTIVVSVAILGISVALVFLCFLVNELLNPPWTEWYKLLSAGIRSHVNNCRKAYSCSPTPSITVVEVLTASIIGASIISAIIYYNLFVWAYLVLSLPYWILTLLEWLDGGSSDD